MADKFKRLEEVADVPNGWEYVPVEKEHQPAKEKTTVTYWDLARKVKAIEKELSSLSESKAALEAEMVNVKTAVEVSSAVPPSVREA